MHDSAGAAQSRGATRFLLVGGGLLVALLVRRHCRHRLRRVRRAGTPALASLHAVVGGGSSQVFASDGTRLGFIQSDELRSPVTWSEIPQSLKDATVAIEDQRFYKDDGIDVTGIFRAAVKDVVTGAPCREPPPSPCSSCATSTSAATSARSDRRSQRPSSPSNTTNATASARSSAATSTASLRHARRTDHGRRAGRRAHLLR